MKVLLRILAFVSICSVTALIWVMKSEPPNQDITFVKKIAPGIGTVYSSYEKEKMISDLYTMRVGQVGIFVQKKGGKYTIVSGKLRNLADLVPAYAAAAFIAGMVVTIIFFLLFFELIPIPIYNKD